MSEEQSLASYIASITGVSGQYLQPPGGLPLRSEKAMSEWFGGLDVPEEHQEEYNAIAKKLLSRDKQGLFSVIAKAVKIKKAESSSSGDNQNGRLLMYPMEYIARSTARAGYRLRKDGVWYVDREGHSEVIKTKRVISTLKADLFDHNRGTGRQKYFPLEWSSVESQFEEFMHNQEERLNVELSKLIRYEKGFEVKTREWLERLHTLMKLKQPLDIWMTVMSHYMWCVKRRVMKSTERVIAKYPIWVSIFGNQGVGKDYVTEHVIFGPLEGRYAVDSIAILEDFKREVEKFSKNFVINFNELVSNSDQREDGMEALSKGAIALIKMFLTNDKFDVRTYHTQSQEVMIRRCEFFSTANFHLYDLIRDQSGMRRFFEFESLQPKLVQFDNAEVKALAELATAAWIGIDENRDDGYFIPSSDIGKQIVAIQDTYRGTTTIHQWLEHDGMEFSDNYAMDITAAHATYRRWCAKAGIQRVYALPNFKKMLDLYGAIDPTSGLCNIDEKEGAL